MSSDLQFDQIFGKRSDVASQLVGTIVTSHCRQWNVRSVHEDIDRPRCPNHYRIRVGRYVADLSDPRLLIDLPLSNHGDLIVDNDYFSNLDRSTVEKQ